MKFSIIGQGKMAQAIRTHLEDSGNSVELIGRTIPDTLANTVILAIPYTAHESFISEHHDKLAGKTVIDICNPVNFNTLDELIVPPGQSAAALLQSRLPHSSVLKAFNTTSAFILNSKQVAGRDCPTVLIAGDNLQAKKSLQHALSGSTLNAVDTGSLKQAAQLEALGLLQMYLVKNNTVSQTGGFSLLGLPQAV